MSISTQATYSEPKITRTPSESTIEFDITTPSYTAWESIRIERDEVGDIRITSRDMVADGPLWIPPVILPHLLAEIDRLASGDGDLPLAPFAPVAAIHPRDPHACYICGQGEHAPTELHAFWSNADAQREFEGVPEGPLPSMTAAETLDPREAVIL